MTTRTLRMIGAMAAVGVLAACGTTPTEDDYGKSLASMISASAYNPATLTSPSDAAVTGVDPDYANNVVIEMRKDVPKPEDVRKPINVQAFSTTGGW